MVLSAMNSNHIFRNKVAELSEIPKDVALGSATITITGESEISIENHKGILEYTDSIIRVRTKSGKISIKGFHLLVDSYSNDEMIIKGNIESVEFIK